MNYTIHSRKVRSSFHSSVNRFIHCQEVRSSFHFPVNRVVHSQKVNCVIHPRCQHAGVAWRKYLNPHLPPFFLFFPWYFDRSTLHFQTFHQAYPCRKTLIMSKRHSLLQPFHRPYPLKILYHKYIYMSLNTHHEQEVRL